MEVGVNIEEISCYLETFWVGYNSENGIETNQDRKEKCHYKKPLYKEEISIVDNKISTRWNRNTEYATFYREVECLM